MSGSRELTKWNRHITIRLVRFALSTFWSLRPQLWEFCSKIWYGIKNVLKNIKERSVKLKEHLPALHIRIYVYNYIYNMYIYIYIAVSRPHHSVSTWWPVSSLGFRWKSKSCKTRLLATYCSAWRTSTAWTRRCQDDLALIGFDWLWLWLFSVLWCTLMYFVHLCSSLLCVAW